jgi:hypothetical protein
MSLTGVLKFRAGMRGFLPSPTFLEDPDSVFQRKIFYLAKKIFEKDWKIQCDKGLRKG